MPWLLRHALVLTINGIHCGNAERSPCARERLLRDADRPDVPCPIALTSRAYWMIVWQGSCEGALLEACLATWAIA